MKTLSLTFVLCVAFVASTTAQTSNLLNYVNFGTGANSGTGEGLRTGAIKINNDLGFLANMLDADFAQSVTNITFTNTTTLTSGASATATNYGVIGNIAYISLGIPQGIQGPPATNALYPTVESTLTNINPLYCTGSNYIGYFSQVFDYNLQLPNTGSGLTLGTNLAENIYGSYDKTNWFLLTNSLTSDGLYTAIFTNLYVSISGDNNTNYAGALTIYALSNPQYYGQTNQFLGQHCQFGTPTAAGDAVNLTTMQTAIANAVGSTWNTVVDTNSVTHYRYSPYGQVNEDLTANQTTWTKLTGFKPSGTNWLLSVTNLPAGYVVQTSTNLLLPFGWASLTSGYTMATNSGTITFTIPQYLIPASYAFFRVVAFQVATATFYPPLTLNSGTLYPSNTWSLAAITNGMGNWSFWEGNSNGQALVSVWISNGVPAIKQLAP